MRRNRRLSRTAPCSAFPYRSPMAHVMLNVTRPLRMRNACRSITRMPARSSQRLLFGELIGDREIAGPSSFWLWSYWSAAGSKPSGGSTLRLLRYNSAIRALRTLFWRLLTPWSARGYGPKDRSRFYRAARRIDGAGQRRSFHTSRSPHPCPNRHVSADIGAVLSRAVPPLAPVMIGPGRRVEPDD
jgi:hypothetical protein